MKLKSQSIKSVAYGTNQILKSIKYGNIKFSIVISADNTHICVPHSPRITMTMKMIKKVMTMKKLKRSGSTAFCICNQNSDYSVYYTKIYTYITFIEVQSRLAKVGPGSPGWDLARQGGTRAFQGGTRL